MAIALLCSVPEIADARQYRITISTRPSKATVFLGNGKKLGTTPLKTRLPGGEHVIIIRKSGFIELVDTIEVGRRNRRFKLTLERAEKGEIRVVSTKGRALRGASIYIDNKEVGEVPKTIKVDAGLRHVEVKKSGFEPFDEWVEVSAGNRAMVRAFARAKAGAGPVRPPDKGGDDEELELDDDDDFEELGDDDDIAEVGDDDDDDEVKVTRSGAPAARPRGSLAVIRAGVDLGGRRFTYKNPTTDNLRPYNAFPFPLGRVSAELYPLGFSDSVAARGLGVTAEIALSAPLNSETTDEQPDAIATSWMDWSVGARYRYPMSPALDLGLAGSFGKRAFNFEDEGSMVEGEVPDIDYTQIAVGLDLDYDASDNMVVSVGARYILLSGFGEVGERFNASGFGLGGWLRVAFAVSSRFDVIVQGSFQRDALTLEMADAAFQADGGTDLYGGALLGIGLNL